MHKKRDLFWQSPISIEQVSSAQISFGDLYVDASRVFWTESRPLEKGRHALMSLENNGTILENFSTMSIQTKVHEYGGGAFCPDQDSLIFFDAYSSSLYVQDSFGNLKCLAKDPHKRWADFCLSPDGKFMVCLCEDHSEGEIENRIVIWDLHTHLENVFHDTADFYASPRWSPDGKFIAFLMWNFPSMPWDECFLQICSYPDSKESLCIGSAKESIGEFLWTGPEEIVFTSDRNGFSNLYLWTKRGEIHLYDKNVDVSLPLWILGKRRFASTRLFGKEGLIVAFCEKGIDRLAFLEKKSRNIHVLDLPYTVIRTLAVGTNGIYLIAGSPTMPLSVVCLSEDILKETILATSSKYSDSLKPFLSEPQEVVAMSSLDCQKVYGLLYLPKHPKHICSSPPPLIIKCHSGPTAHVSPFLQWEIQFWTSRGFAWLDVNYRGSSGFGRKYREALQYKWGLIDVQDCWDLANSLVFEKKVDGEALFAKGGSSGGFTALGMAGHCPDLKGCISWYGVTDLLLLTEDTHKFEKYYLDSLIGCKEQFPMRYKTRSPCCFFEKITCPVLLLHGDRDSVVPLKQAEDLHRKIPLSQLKVFSGEGHGFRQAETLRACLETELAFYAKCLDN